MEKEQVDKWLGNTIANLFMDFCFYDRKEDEEMNGDQMRKFMDDGTISKEKMIAAFTTQINNEYNED